MKVILKMRHEH